MNRPDTGPGRCLLRFDSLFAPGRGLAFPCDEGGRVRLDELSEPARCSYFAALSKIGRELSQPYVWRPAAAPG
jgi:hypothetical protein